MIISKLGSLEAREDSHEEKERVERREFCMTLAKEKSNVRSLE